jgi:hypothetical protein
MLASPGNLRDIEEIPTAKKTQFFSTGMPENFWQNYCGCELSKKNLTQIPTDFSGENPVREKSRITPGTRHR